MRILGVDFGDRKVGFAVSDPFGWTAQGIELMRYKGNWTQVIERIIELIKQYSVQKVIVGLPKNMNNTVGERGCVTIEFSDKLAEAINPLPVELWDERLTTKMAKATMAELGLSIKQKKKAEDKIAAVFLLQNYLDARSI